MNLTDHFTLAEFTASEKATLLRIDNSLPPELLPAAIATCQMMELVRAKLSQIAGREIAIIPSSGYRCLALNRAVGSGDSSDHIKARAMDFAAPSFGTPYQVASALSPYVNELGIGQLILEGLDGKRWVHASDREPDKVINRIITITDAGVRVGIQAVA